ncbi:MAG: TrmH family RNA methyltransferase [Flavobacteriales bacterium]
MSTDLYEYLTHHLTGRKRELFDQVANERTRHLTVVLEDIYQTQNASAIMRSAESWGVQDIHVIENEHAFNFHRRISKGAYDWLTICRYNESAANSLACMHALKQEGYSIAATSLEDSAMAPEDIPLDRPLAIVMGTELTGVSETVRTHCDHFIKIPMRGFTESLNVSVASGVLMYTLMNRLRASGISWRLPEEAQLELKIQWARKAIAWSETLIELFESGERL